MKKTIKVLGYFSFFILIIGCFSYIQRFELTKIFLELPEYEYTDVEISSLKVPMRDGVELHTRVLMPKGPGPWPTVQLHYIK